MIDWLRRLFGAKVSAMQSSAKSWFPTPEEQALADARREAAAARAYAQRVLEEGREEMHWLERAMRGRPRSDVPPPARTADNGEVLQ